MTVSISDTSQIMTHLSQWALSTELLVRKEQRRCSIRTHCLLHLLTEINRYNVYSQITSSKVNCGSYNGNDQYPTSDIINSGAILIASLMTSVDWTDISTGLCASVASYFEKTFTSKGVTVWLRFAHEMNYYSTADSGVYPGGCKLFIFYSSDFLCLLGVHLAYNNFSKLCTVQNLVAAHVQRDQKQWQNIYVLVPQSRYVQWACCPLVIWKSICRHCWNGLLSECPQGSSQLFVCIWQLLQHLRSSEQASICYRCDWYSALGRNFSIDSTKGAVAQECNQYVRWLW